MADTVIRKVKETFHKNSFYIPCLMLVSALIYLPMHRGAVHFPPDAQIFIGTVISIWLPLMLFMRLSERRGLPLELRHARFRDIPLFISSLAVLFLLYFIYTPLMNKLGLYCTPFPGGVGGSQIPYILTVAFLMLSLELMCHGILFTQYTGYGILSSVLVSAELLALFFLDLYLLPLFFTSAIVTGIMRVYTRSPLLSAIAHPVAVVLYMLSRGSELYFFAVKNPMLAIIAAAILILFFSFIIFALCSHAFPDYTESESGDVGSGERLFASLSPATVILILITIFLR